MMNAPILDLLARIEDEVSFDMFQGRFAYWRGFSGKRYIHTVYQTDALDDLSGGVAILVDETGEVLHVLLIEEGAAAFAHREGAASAHVHFPKNRSGLAVRNDLRNALVNRIAAL